MGTTNKNLELPAYNSTNWNTPLNSNFTIIDNCFGSTKTVTVSTTTVPLIAADAQNMRFYIQGTVPAATTVYITMPDGIAGSWIFTNVATVGAGATIQVKTVSGLTAIVLSPGSAILYSDGGEFYSATSGAVGSYLPTSGGTLSGPLTLQSDFTTGASGTSVFNNNAYFNGNMILAAGKSFTVNGTLALGTSSLAAGSLALNGASIGSDKLSVLGTSTFGGNTVVSSGNLTITLGSLAISSSLAASSLAGTTTIPSGATLNIASGATLTVNGTFSPTTLSVGTLTTTTSASLSGTTTIPSGSSLTIAAGATFTNSGGYGAISCTSVTASGAISASSISASSAVISGSLSAGSFSPSSISTGAITCSSLNAGSGAITTGGNITGANHYGAAYSSSSGYYAGVSNTNVYMGSSFVVNVLGAGSQLNLASNGDLAITGNAYKPGGGTWTATPSDQRAKKNIINYTKSIFELSQISPVTYEYNGEYGSKEDGKTYYGFIAQSLIGTPFESMVTTYEYKGNQMYSVDFTELTFALLNAVKELGARVAQLESKS